MLKIPFSPNFNKNIDRTNSHGDYPCIVCGLKCSNPKNMVYVDSGFSHILTEEEYTHDEGEMGLYPIGPDCLKKHPEIKPYARKQ